MTEAQNDVRGLIVTGEGSLSSDFEEAAWRVPQAVARLRKLVADNQGQQQRADALGGEIRAFMAVLAETHRLAREGRTAEAAERLRGLVRDRSTERIRAEVDRFLVEEDRLDRARHERLRRPGRRSTGRSSAGRRCRRSRRCWPSLRSAGGSPGGSPSWDENARRLAAGKALAAPIGGGDEISRLDAVFHAMAASWPRRTGRTRCSSTASRTTCARRW